MSALVAALDEVDAVLPAVDAAIRGGTEDRRYGALLDLIIGTPAERQDVLSVALAKRLAAIPAVLHDFDPRGPF